MGQDCWQVGFVLTEQAKVPYTVLGCCFRPALGGDEAARQTERRCAGQIVSVFLNGIVSRHGE